MTAQKNTLFNSKLQTRTNYYTPEDIAKLLKVHHQTIRRYIHQGKIRAIKLPSQRGAYRVAEQDYLDFLKENYK